MCYHCSESSVNSYNDTEKITPVRQLNRETADVENAATSSSSARKQHYDSADNAAEESTQTSDAVSTVEQSPDLRNQLKTSSDMNVNLLGCRDVIRTKQSVGYTR